MKTQLLVLAAALSIAVPTFAQNRHEGRPEGSRGEQHQRDHIDRNREDARERAHESERGHYDGRNFDRDYRNRYFGPAHAFRPEIEVCYGGGFQFFYGGFYFGFLMPLPYPDAVYFVDEGPDGFYYLYAPAYPAFSMRVSVIL